MTPSSAKRPASRESSPSRRRTASFSGSYDSHGGGVFPMVERSSKVLERLEGSTYMQLYTVSGKKARWWRAQVGEPWWNLTHGVAEYTAVWRGGPDDGTPVSLPNPLARTAPGLQLDSYLLGLAGHPLGTDTFQNGFFGLDLSEGVKDMWPTYTDYAKQFSRDANLLDPNPTGIISWDSKHLDLANYGASGTRVDDGLTFLRPERITQIVYEYFELDLLLRAEMNGKWMDKQLDPFFVHQFCLKKPVSNSVGIFKLGPEHILGRGLRPGEFGLQATNDIERGTILGLYTGTYKKTSETSTDPTRAGRHFAVDFAGVKGNIVIEPQSGWDIMQYANDTSVDLANEHGKHNVGAFYPNAIFFPIFLFHFPVILVLASRNIKKGQEIGVDYGAGFRMSPEAAAGGQGMAV